MKLIVSGLTVALLLSGCSQPKNRLADEKNLQYQRRMAIKKPQTNPSQLVVVDVKPPVVPSEGSAQGDTTQVAVIPAQPDTILPAIVEPADEPTGNTVTQQAPAQTTAEQPAATTSTTTTTTTETSTTEQPAATSTTTTQENNVLSVEEQKEIQQGLINNEVNSPEALQALFTINMGSIKSPGLAVLVEENVFNALITDGSEPVTQFLEVKLDVSGKAVIAEGENGFKAYLMCIRECKTLLFVASKEENGTKVVNLPSILKKVGTEYVMAQKAQQTQAAAETTTTTETTTTETTTTTEVATDAAAYIEFDDLMALYQTFAKNGFADQESVGMLFTSMPLDPKTLTFNASGNAEEFNLEVLQNTQSISKVEKAKLDKSGAMAVAEGSNEHKLATMCAKECELVYAVFIKIKEGKIEAHLPNFLKNVNGSYVKAELRSAEHYKQESEKQKAAATASAAQK